MGKNSWRKRIKKNSRMVSGAVAFAVLVVLLGISAWGVRSQKNVAIKAASSCTIVQTDQGPGCWCSDGGWQFHCGNGLVRGDAPSAQCENDCRNRNGTPPEDNNDCSKANTLYCKNNQAWWCNAGKQWEKGTKSCNAQACLPFSPTDPACQDKGTYKRVGSACGSGKTCRKTGEQSGFATCSCRSASVPTPTPTSTPRVLLPAPIISCDFVKVNQEVIIRFDWNDIPGSLNYLVNIYMTKGNNQERIDSKNVPDSEYNLSISEKATYTAKVTAMNNGMITETGVKSCRYTGG